MIEANLTEEGNSLNIRELKYSATWRSWIRESWYNNENNQQDATV
jgi:hypothetical protein